MTAVDVRVKLDQLIRQNGEDFTSLSLMLGRNPTYIQQFIRRGVPKKLHEEDRRRLARHFGVDETELGGQPNPPDHAANAALKPSLMRDFVYIPLYDIKVSAGPGQFPGQEDESNALAFRAQWIRRLTSSPPERLAVLQVDGDSMHPTLAHGDQVLVDMGQTAPLRDGVYVIRVDGVLQVKRISVNPMSRRLSVKSDNPAYESWTDCDPREIDILGRVVWVGRRL